MSRIPRPSPRTLRELPITDDEKKRALPRLKQPIIRPNSENKQEEKKLDNKPKESKKTFAVVPSTSKAVPVHRKLNRSKTQPSIQRENVKGKPSVAKPPQINQKNSKVVKRNDNHAAAAKSTKADILRTEHKENIKKESKKTSVVVPSTSKGIPVHTKLHRSKTEYNIRLENVGKGKPYANKPPQITVNDCKVVKRTDKKAAEAKPKEADIRLTDDEENIKLLSPKEVGHSGLKFAGKRKKTLSFRFNLKQNGGT